MLGCSSEKNYYAIVRVTPGHPEYFESAINRIEITAENDSVACAKALAHFYMALDLLHKDFRNLKEYNKDIDYDPFMLNMTVYNEENKLIVIKPQYKESGLVFISDSVQREIDTHIIDHEFAWSWEKLAKNLQVEK